MAFLVYNTDNSAITDGPFKTKSAAKASVTRASKKHFLKNGNELGLDLHYEESPGGHEWQYWDEQIKRVIEWLPIDSGERKTV